MNQTIPVLKHTPFPRKKPHLLSKLMPQILIQIGAIVITIGVSDMFMTWIMEDLFHINSTYLAALYETMGTLVLTILVLVSLNTWIYRKRLKEILTLSQAILQVSNGDYQYRITFNRREPMADIYEDFNRMTAELSSVQILRQDFINNYSHEFKTPIASISGFAELLLKKEVSPLERQQYLEIIRDESNRLSALAQNTILLSKLTAQQILSDAEEFNLGEELRQCAILCSHSWLEKKQEFNGSFPDLRFTGNRELLRHLWLNLLGNAIKYTPEGGEIQVNLIRQNDHAMVRFTDNGCGMTEETKAHLFSPYYQGDSSRSIQGLGLGLSIAMRIAELHNGTITVESEPDQGSIFTVCLPIRPKPASNRSKL